MGLGNIKGLYSSVLMGNSHPKNEIGLLEGDEIR